jgi:hypothetical protein
MLKHRAILCVHPLVVDVPKIQAMESVLVPPDKVSGLVLIYIPLCYLFCYILYNLTCRRHIAYGKLIYLSY